jgi:hypothetical protein
MAYRYLFIQTCGHTGTGPILHSNSQQQRPSERPTASSTNMIYIYMPFECPFCSPRPGASNGDIPQGSGVLCVLTSTPQATASSTALSRSLSWTPIKSCLFSQINVDEWLVCKASSGTTALQDPYRHVAYIPKPWGRVQILDCEAGSGEQSLETGPVIRVKCAWRQRTGMGGGELSANIKMGEEGRFPGLVSQLNATVVLGQMAGRYI